MSIIDFHSHILPGIDDGARNLDTSMAMLEQIREQKVQKGLQAFVPEHSGALHRKTVVKINFPRGIQIPELADPVKQRRKSSHRKTTHHKAIPP